jgi:hypothetical protein
MKNTAATISACKCIFYIGDAEPNTRSKFKFFDQTARTRVKDAAKFVHFFIMEPTLVVRSIISSIDLTCCWNPFSLHSIAVFVDRSNISVRALTYFYVFIVLAAYTVLILQEDS